MAEANDNPLIWRARYRFISADADHNEIEEMVIDAENIDGALIEAHLSLSDSGMDYRLYSIWTEGEPALSAKRDWDAGADAYFARKRAARDAGLD